MRQLCKTRRIIDAAILPLLALSAISLGQPLSAQTSAAVDPVGKLREISDSVGKSAKELESVATDLDKLSDELDALEKLPPGPGSRKKVEELELRFKTTIKRSETVEKKARTALDDNDKEIASLRKALTSVKSARKAENGATAMSDPDIKECLKNLDDIESTVKDLRKALDDSAIEAEKPKAKKNKTAGSKTGGQTSH